MPQQCVREADVTPVAGAQALGGAGRMSREIREAKGALVSLGHTPRLKQDG